MARAVENGEFDEDLDATECLGEEKEEHAAEVREMARLKAEADELKARISAASARAQGGASSTPEAVGSGAGDAPDATSGDGCGEGSAMAGGDLCELEAQVSVLERQVAAFEGCRSQASSGGSSKGSEISAPERCHSQASSGASSDCDTEGSSDEDEQTPRHETRAGSASGTDCGGALEHALDDLLGLAKSDWASVFADGFELVEESP